MVNDWRRRNVMDDKITLRLLVAAAFIWLAWRLLRRHTRREKPFLRSVAILVLGDIGRSPRMMYHAESFAKIGYETFLIGYGGSKPVPSLLSLPHVRFLYLSEPSNLLSKLPFVITAPIKMFHQMATVLAALMIRIPHPPEFILVQNPPSIPTLALVWLVGQIYGSKVIIDWHNLGYSILAMKLGPNHVFVKIAKRFEATFGRTAYAHLFVTSAMHDYLVTNWGLKGHKAVLHDRPPSHFRRASPQEIHELFLRLKKSLYFPVLASFLPPYSSPYSTPFTTTKTLNSPTAVPSTDLNPSTSERLSSPSPPLSHITLPEYREDRPALLVSSTSWTPDEDFSILLEALILYERRAREVNRDDMKILPRVLMVVTGKGPLKAKYMNEIDALQNASGDEGWKWVRCISLWLEAEDYPILLGSADLGICLHSSSSALDLPMKIVDMFGCGLPVCALEFACLDELVKDGKNGLIFKDATQLSEQIETLLISFPSSRALDNLRASLIESYSAPSDLPHTVHVDTATEGDHWEWNSWTDNWNKVVRPLVLRDADGYHSEWD